MSKKISAILLAFVLICVFVSGCGCGSKKEVDPAKQQVLQISITPIPTPTPDPGEINADAVTRSGSVTMVNGYLADATATTGMSGVTPGAETAEAVSAEGDAEQDNVQGEASEEDNEE